MERSLADARPIKGGMSRGFWFVLGGQWISQIGDGLHIVALPMFTLATSGATLSLGLVMAGALFPFTLLSPFAGVLADRWNRKWLLVTSDTLSGTIALTIAFLAWTGKLSIWILFLASAALSAMSAFLFPTLMALVPNLVQLDRLTRANSLIGFSRQSSTIIGPALGGILIASLGFPLAFLLNGLSFLCSALIVGLSSIPQTQIPRSSARLSILSDLAGGVKYLVRHRLLLSIVCIIVVLNFFEPAILPVVMPVVADRVLRVGDVGYGMMRSIYGLGGLISLTALAAVREQPRKHRLIVAGVAGIGATFLILAMGITVYPLVLTALFLYGVLVSITDTLILVLLQTYVQDEGRGTVFGVVATISAALMPISFLVVGFILDHNSPIWFLLASAAVLAAGSVALYHAPGIRNV